MGVLAYLDKAKYLVCVILIQQSYKTDKNNYLFGLMSITWMGWKSPSDLVVQRTLNQTKIGISIYTTAPVSLLYTHIIGENMELGKGHKRRKKCIF